MKVIEQNVPVLRLKSHQLSGRFGRIIVGLSVSNVDYDRRVGSPVFHYPQTENIACQFYGFPHGSPILRNRIEPNWKFYFGFD